MELRTDPRDPLECPTEESADKDKASPGLIWLLQQITSDKGGLNKFHQQPTFEVDARSAKVFKAPFFTPSAPAPPVGTAWTDFMHAMAAVSFVSETLYGSVWQFQPTRLDVDRPIQTHQPFPCSRMGYRVTRHIGRRLERAYGWEVGMFVLKQEA